MHGQDEDRPGQSTAHRGEDLSGGTGVEAGGWFVDEQHVGSRGESTGDVAVLLSFVSSIFVPVDQLPGWLAEIGRIFPLYHVATGVQTALGTAGDTSLRAGNVAVLLAWAVGGVIVAARGFRWEPRATAA